MREITQDDIQELTAALEHGGVLKVVNIEHGPVDPIILNAAGFTEGLGMQVEVMHVSDTAHVFGLFAVVQPGVVDFDEMGVKLLAEFERTLAPFSGEPEDDADEV